MAESNKLQESMLKKLGVSSLNSMQVIALKEIPAHSELIILSPTGSGKTLAFLLPIISMLDSKVVGVQVLILVPSRELAIQIEQVVREMGSGFKANAVYGGRGIIKDKSELKSPPAILIGTPGRVADHLRRDTVSTKHLRILVFDEFDKSLEIGFEEQMTEILEALPTINKKILTSATQKIEIPSFIGLANPKILDFTNKSTSQLTVKLVTAPSKNKLETLRLLLQNIGKQNGIVFCNYKDSIREVSGYLKDHNIEHGCFYGGLDQMDRERALIKFRNGTNRILIATDLAARGIDVPEMDFIIHYELPYKKEEFIHRNGRTARMNKSGTAYVIKSINRNLPEFIVDAESITLDSTNTVLSKDWETLFISGGRKDKISKGDIAGLFFKQANLEKDELGTIELKQDCAFVSVPFKKARKIAELLNNTKLKKKKVRIRILE